MQLKKRIIQNIMILAIVGSGIYVLAYFMRSRSSWHTNERPCLWSFYQPPVGLVPTKVAVSAAMHNAGSSRPGELSPWDEWQKKEKLIERFFFPCIWLDRLITGRQYWPSSNRGIAFT